MKKLGKRELLILLLSILLILAYQFIQVRKQHSIYTQTPDLERLISLYPEHWHPVKGIEKSKSWQQAAKSDYDVVVDRTYQHDNGQLINVVMTWSRDGIRRAGHIQQLCYTAQGSIIKETKDINIKTDSKSFKITNFVAYIPGGFVEDVFYWRLTGGELEQNRSSFESIDARLSHRILKMVRMFSLLYGKIPDNIMVRVSAVRKDNEQPSNLAIEYIKEYINILSSKDRKIITGL